MSILVGNGALYYLEEMERGADGAMTGFGFPEMLVGVYDRFTAGDHDGPADLFDATPEEHTSELQSLMRSSYAVFCLTKKIVSTPIRTPLTAAPTRSHT